ncbi:GH92 family glycosyl hydrolase [Chitinophaga sp. 212800008-4]|uniref:GH92 family glycosyl hydrolase n=1 Tax=unclassified Chitinophaga TaxID=2619133 RepID=UPI0030D020DA
MKRSIWRNSSLLLLTSVISLSTQAAVRDSIPDRNTDMIDPRIGNVGQLLEPTRPTVQLPNQLIRFTPQRKDYMDDQIDNFPLTIVSHRMGQVFSVKPVAGTPDKAARNRRMAYDHDLEINRPWYYSTWLLDDQINVEFAAGRKTGCYRFRFPQQPSGRSLLFGVYNGGASSYNLLPNNIIKGVETYHDDIKVYMYGVFSQQATLESGSNGTAEIAVGFPASASEVVFRYAISYISPEEAEQHFREEISHTSFDEVVAAGKAAWDKVMDQINVKGGTPAQRRSFYTALYRCYERAVDISEDGKYYSGFDKQIHADNRPFYVDDWSWDTYLALHPLRMILDPAKEEDMLNSYVHMYEQSGWMPTFPVLFGDHACMNGFHSSVIMLDAWRKGLRRFNIETAYEGMRKNATEATMLPWRNGPKTSLDDVYRSKGYFPALHPGEKETVAEVHSFEKRQAVAVTLGGAYDDWAVAELAGELNKKADQQRFAPRAKNYQHLWNAEKQFFMPKDADGNWININVKFDGGLGGRDYYDENNGWTYLWQVQHDIPGLITLMGGKQAFVKRLDQLFRESLDMSRYNFWNKFPDATGLVGQFSMGNEPSFHIPYLYNYAGAPWKTQQRIRFLLDTWFKDNVFGIPGDEDGGGMSAFVVFSSMGFYPVTPGIPEYTIGSPVFEHVTIALPDNRQFTIIAHDCSVVNKYIQQAKFNGQPLSKPFFTHQQLMNGGTLELFMGPKPGEAFAASLF